MSLNKIPFRSSPTNLCLSRDPQALIASIQHDTHTQLEDQSYTSCTGALLSVAQSASVAQRDTSHNMTHVHVWGNTLGQYDTGLSNDRCKGSPSMSKVKTQLSSQRERLTWQNWLHLGMIQWESRLSLAGTNPTLCRRTSSNWRTPPPFATVQHKHVKLSCQVV